MARRLASRLSATGGRDIVEADDRQIHGQFEVAFFATLITTTAISSLEANTAAGGSARDSSLLETRMAQAPADVVERSLEEADSLVAQRDQLQGELNGLYGLVLLLVLPEVLRVLRFRNDQVIGP